MRVEQSPEFAGKVKKSDFLNLIFAGELVAVGWRSYLKGHPLMPHASTLVLPTDPSYTAHREAEKQHQETLGWLRRRERALTDAATSEAPSLVPDDERDSRGTTH
jgi:hypothetical protein